MKYIIKNKKGFRTIGLAVLLLSSGSLYTSCSKINDVESTSLATEKTNWKSLEDGRANLMSVYGLMRSATVADNGHWLFGDLRHGDFAVTNRSDLRSIVADELNASHLVINRITNWRRFYAVINAASLFIERAPEIREHDDRYTEINLNVDVAQARMLRAFAYFYMSRIWGDVPLLTSSHDGNFINVPRTPQAQVLNYATQELLDAAQVVPFRYGGTDPIMPGLYYGNNWPSWNGNIFTRLSAYVILAHIAAWQGNYVDAAAYSKFVLDNQSTQVSVDGAFSLSYIKMDALTENENGYSPFAYKRANVLVGFPFEQGNGLASSNGHIEQLTLASPFIPKARPEIFVPKDTIIKAFTNPKDLRFSIDPVSGKYYTNYFYDFESDLPIFNKIKVVYPVGSSSGKITTFFSSTMLFSRMEEITLLCAEAFAMLGDEDEAFRLLNKAADLRGISFVAKDTPDLIDAIFAERRRELMGEGHRWYDLVRYNRIKRSNAVFAEKNGREMTFAEFEAAGGIYWPVSEEVRGNNGLITQNPYWE